MSLQVLLVDDHTVLRKGLRLLLEEEEDFTVVGEAGDGREAIELFRKLTPDVVVMDVSMKGLNGIEATRHIVSEVPGTKVVALSIHSGRRYVEGMLDAGAAGYILKDSAPEDLVEGIRTVMRGEVFLSTAIVGIVVSKFRADLRRRSLKDGSAQLTTRDSEILRLLVAGDTDAQIAATLRLGKDSVATARRRLMDELGVHDDAELVEAAGDLGLLTGEAAIGGPQEWDPDPKFATTPIRNTKLHRPSIPEDHVHRPRLVERLDKSCDLPLTLVSAPAGYGKSQLCGCWVSTCGLPSAWMSLDDDDDDLRRFLHCFLAAVGSLFPEAIEESRSLAGASILPPVSVLADALTNDLDWIEEDFILVLDDFHSIRSQPVHDLITELLRHPPKPLHLVLITRHDPGLPLAQLRAAGRVNEVRSRELRFTAPETAALLEKVTGLTVDDDALAQLEKKLEGWVVGLRLVALAMGQADSPEKLVEGMSGGIQHIREYLLEEVLVARSPQIRDWLLKTSVLDRFCEPLCTAVCAVDARPGSTDLDGGQFIDALFRCNLFTIPLDTEGRWYRYHHNFQELLQDQLKLHMDSDEIAAVHSRAGAWFESHSLFQEAIDHHLESSNTERAAQVAEQNLLPMLHEGTWHLVGTWLSRFPESFIMERPKMMLARAYEHFQRVELAKIPPILDRIDDLMDGDPETHSFSGEVALFRGACAFHDADGALSLKHLEHALDQIPTTKTHWRATSERFFMLACQMEGQRERADVAMTTWLGNETPPHPLRKTHILQTSGFLMFIAGDLEAIKQKIPEQRVLAEANNLEHFLAWCDYLGGLSHLHQGDFDAAIRLLTAASERKYLHYSRAAADAMASLTIAYQACGLPQRAADSLQSLREFVIHLGGPVAIVADSCATRLRVMQGQSEVAVWETKLGPSVPKQPMVVWFETPLITRCRALIADATGGGLDEAQERLQIYIDFNEAHHNTLQLIGLKTLQAVAFDKQDKPEEALTVLGQAVELGRPGGFVFPFLELGSHMARMLRSLPERDSQAAFVEHILSAFERTREKVTAGDAERPRGSRPPLEKLTNRELEVINLLGRRFLDKEIAAKLYISASTVNSHCKSIYQKLGVSNRRQAVAKGTELGILDRK